MTGRPLVLFVEDDDALRFVIGRELRRLAQEAGARFIDVGDGEAALGVLTDGPNMATPTLVISDYLMPRMSGLELLHAVRTLVPKAPLRFVILSSMERREDEAAVLAAGAQRFVVKPYGLDALRATLGELVGEWAVTLNKPSR